MRSSSGMMHRFILGLGGLLAIPLLFILILLVNDARTKLAAGKKVDALNKITIINGQPTDAQEIRTAGGLGNPKETSALARFTVTGSGGQYLASVTAGMKSQGYNATGEPEKQLFGDNTEIDAFQQKFSNGTYTVAVSFMLKAVVKCTDETGDPQPCDYPVKYDVTTLYDLDVNKVEASLR